MHGTFASPVHQGTPVVWVGDLTLHLFAIAAMTSHFSIVRKYVARQRVSRKQPVHALTTASQCDLID